MSAEHPNATAYRRTADAFRAQDLAALETLIDPAVVWHVPGQSRRAGELRGRDDVLAWLADVMTTGFWLREHDVIGNDEHVCALSTMGQRGDGLDVETRVVSVFHFRDGRQFERWFYPDDAATFDEILDAPGASS